MKTLIKLKFGSDLYGCRTENSDTDWKSVHISSANEIIMQSCQRVISRSTGNSTTKNTANDVDDESFSLLKFFDMLKRGDMVSNEILFVTETYSEYMSSVWKDLIIPNREKFLCRDIKGFVGYIRTQVGRYGVRGSRVSTSRYASEMFASWISSYGPNAKIKDVPDFEYFFDCFIKLHEHSSIVYLPAAKNSTETIPYFEAVNRKVGYNISLKEAHSIYKRAFDEFGARALAAEQNEGVDWKSCYHAIRVSEQAMELLQTGNITFPRQNVDDLLSIKRGEHPYREIATRLETNLDNLEKLMLVSELPEAVDENFMDEVVHELHLDQIRKNYFV